MRKPISAVTECTTVGQMRAALLAYPDEAPLSDPFTHPVYVVLCRDTETGAESVEVA